MASCRLTDLEGQRYLSGQAEQVEREVMEEAQGTEWIFELLTISGKYSLAFDFRPRKCLVGQK